jgi:uncharacterized membrane protein
MNSQNTYIVLLLVVIAFSFHTSIKAIKLVGFKFSKCCILISCCLFVIKNLPNVFIYDLRILSEHWDFLIVYYFIILSVNNIIDHIVGDAKISWKEEF